MEMPAAAATRLTTRMAETLAPLESTRMKPPAAEEKKDPAAKLQGAVQQQYTASEAELQPDNAEKQRDVDLLEAELQRANARIQLLHDNTTTLGSAVASLEADKASLELDNEEINLAAHALPFPVTRQKHTAFAPPS
jgi:ABC-type phosphate transport system auxiliary subunit